MNKNTNGIVTGKAKNGIVAGKVEVNSGYPPASRAQAPASPPDESINSRLAQLEKMLDYEAEEIERLRISTDAILKPELSGIAGLAESPCPGSRVASMLDGLIAQVCRNTGMIQEIHRLVDL